MTLIKSKRMWFAFALLTCFVTSGSSAAQGKLEVKFVAADTLMKAFADNEDAARKKYAGLAPVVVEGTVLEVRKSKSGSIYVDLKGHSEQWKVTCDFEKMDVQTILDTVKAGQKVTVAGAGYGPVVQREVLIAFCKLIPTGKALPDADPKTPPKKTPVTPPKKSSSTKPEPPLYKQVKGLITYEGEKEGWRAVELVRGLEYLTNRGYAITKMPKEMLGVHVLVYPNTVKGWLRPGHVTMQKDGYLYVAIWTKAYGETRVNAAALAAFEDDGWKILEEPFETSFPPGEDWQWKALRKAVTKGQNEFPWPRGLVMIDTQFIFAFRERKE